MLPINHKTVFLLDESVTFVKAPSGQKVDFDVATKSRGTLHVDPVEKSLWTCAVEAVSEYCRIVWDVYPDGERLISVASALATVEKQISWNSGDQCLPYLTGFLARQSFTVNSISNIRTNSVGNLLVCGAKRAIEQIGELSPMQLSLLADHKEGLINRGRIVCISCFQNDSQVAELQKNIAAAVADYNNKSSAEHSKAEISQIELVIVNSFPLNSNNSMISSIQNQSISAHLKSEVHTCKSGTLLAQKLVSLVLRHYDLASTTVTGIPMKEEQNASSSANYDVEIMHPADAHFDLQKVINIEGVKVPKDGMEYNTILLKWCTPRTNAVEMHFSTSASRITPVDVNSRPSSCLTNFLLSGRTVMLEMPRAKSGKIMSHMLSSHNNELYIHTLSTSRSILEDPPSISEGSGGRVTDYRINDFGELMKKNRIVRYKSSQIKKDLLTPLDKAHTALKRQTIYWPMAIGNTILFNVQGQISKLLSLFPNDSLTTDQVNECKNSIYQIVDMDRKVSTLPVPSITSRGKGPKREELYRMLWKELEHYLSRLAVTPEHHEIIECFNEMHSKETSDGQPIKKTDLKPKLEELALLDRYNQMTEKEKVDLSAEPTRKKTRLNSSLEQCFTNVRGQDSLLSLWTKKLSTEESDKHQDFVGRKDINFKFYRSLDKKEEKQTTIE